MQTRQAYASLRSRNPVDPGVVEAPGYPQGLETFHPPSYSSLSLEESSVTLFQEFADHAAQATQPFASFMGNATPLAEAPRHTKAAVNAGLRALEALRLSSPMPPEVVTLTATSPYWDVANVSLACENVHALTGHVVSGSSQGTVQFVETAPGFSPIVPSVVTRGHAVVEGLQEATEALLTLDLSEGDLRTTADVTTTTASLGISVQPEVTHNQATMTFVVDDPRTDYHLEVQGKPASEASYSDIPVSHRTATFSGLNPNTLHDIRYRVVRNLAQTPYRTTQLTTTELPGPVVPSVTHEGLRTLRVQWEPPSANPPVEDYQLTWEYTSPGFPLDDSRTGLQTVTVLAAEYAIAGLNYDSAVRVRVSARNSNGSGPQTQAEAQTPPTIPPPAPAAPSFAAHTETSITLSYVHVEHEPAVGSYNVQLTSPDSQVVSFVHQHTGGSTIVASNLTAGPDQLYSIEIAAVNTTGASEASPAIQAYTADLAAPTLGTVEYLATPEHVTVTLTGVADNSGGTVSVFAFLTSETLDSSQAKAVTELGGYQGAAGIGSGTLTCTTFYSGSDFAQAVPNANYTLHVLAIDRVGNFDHRVFQNVSIADNVPPTVAASLSSASSSGVTVAGTFGDDYSFPVTLTSALLTGSGELEGAPTAVSNSGGGSSQPFSVSFSQAWNGTELISLHPGIQANVTLLAEDASGNTSGSVVHVDIPDTTAPVVSLSGDAGATGVSYSVVATDDSGQDPALKVFWSKAEQTSVPEGFTGVATEGSGTLTTAFGLDDVGPLPTASLGTTFIHRAAL